MPLTQRRALSVASLTTALCASALPAATAAPAKSTDDLEATIAGMTLEEKVGQLFVTYVHGATADDRHSPRTAGGSASTPPPRR